MTYTEFIKKSREIINGFKQDGFAWREGYDTSFLDMVSEANPDFKKTKDNLPETLDRNTVRSYFHSNVDLYKGFVACMLWGGIDAKRPKDNLKATNAYKAFTFPKEDVEKKLKSVKKYLDKRNIDAAFSSMANPKKNKIPGIGVSFFTKLLYFMSPIEVIPRPLIYDKWSTYIHCALLIDNQKENTRDYYKGVNKDGSLSRAKPAVDLYKDYLNKMKETAEENGIDNVSRLEAFLFGYARNRAGHKEEKQRRTLVEKYILDYFAEKTSGSTSTARNRSKNKSTNGPDNKPSLLTKLSNGKLRRDRQILFGYSVPFEGRNYYLFVGEKPSFHFLELLTEKSKGRIEECSLLRELECMGFNKKGKDYIYKRLSPYDNEEAKRQLDEIVKRMTNNDQE